MLRRHAPVLFFCLVLLSLSNLSFPLSSPNDSVGDPVLDSRFRGNDKNKYEDKIPACKISYQKAKADLLSEIDRLENFYARYRWLESKIRIMSYEDLWQARRESMDALSKDIRERGRVQEERLQDILKKWDHESAEAFKGLTEGIQQLANHEKDFESCCPEKNFVECIDQSLLPVFDEAQLGLEPLGHLFEHEREYRKEVEQTVGGRQGLYPEDTVEDKTKHKDFYARFEIDRRAARFEEDRQMIHYFENLKKHLTVRFSGEDCCYTCGKTEWEAKTDKMFREV